MSQKNINEITEELKNRIQEAEKVLVGIGSQWKEAPLEAYRHLYEMVKEKDYYIVTTLTDGVVYEAGFDPSRITAPCGNIHWRQCSKACTKDIWEEGELPEEICPHCGAPLTANTVEAETYIEEGYLPGWEAYKHWQAATLNKKLVILELGEGFKYPTVMRWPFEKVAFFNQKACLYRVNRHLSQVPEELGERAVGVDGDSVEFVAGMV